ncbi:hypothetical protein RRG08_016131 [Elysia crispata]|uniref:Uncharacterized protein n=1 Tax=Elysia crispata TaxID=231223 RepID=A0AAE1D8S6_9GAST|nr:hypothetical protein RRG08_016131 [Elysia crispata]
MIRAWLSETHCSEKTTASHDTRLDLERNIQNGRTQDFLVAPPNHYLAALPGPATGHMTRPPGPQGALSQHPTARVTCVHKRLQKESKYMAWWRHLADPDCQYSS